VKRASRLYSAKTNEMKSVLFALGNIRPLKKEVEELRRKKYLHRSFLQEKK
jgi:hypothetical protein